MKWNEQRSVEGLALLLEGYDESEAKQKAFEKIPPVFQKELGDVYIDKLA